MQFFTKVNSRLAVTVVAMGLLSTVCTTRSMADESSDAKAVTLSFLKCTDQNDAESAYKLVGEQWKRTQSRSEIVAGLQTWISVKGGSGTHELVVQKTMGEDEARALSPGATVKGNVYVFRYRTKYPKTTAFEDIYVSKDSDGVLRISGYRPQPAE